MNKGFIGRAASTYFENVSKIVKEGEDCIEDGKTLFASLKTTNSGGKNTSNLNYFKLENSSTITKAEVGKNDDFSGQFKKLSANLLSNLSEQSVVVNEDKYEVITQSSIKMETNIQTKLNYVIKRIETLCKDKYNIPSATPKIGRLLDEIKRELNTHEELSKEAINILNGYVMAIDEADY